MKINRVRYLKGPNYFNFKPTLWIELDIEEFENQPSNTLPGFADALLEGLPGLKRHTCSMGYQGGFAQRLKEGTWMGHILEHMAIELQTLAGIGVSHGKTITSDTQGIYYVTFEYEEEKSGLLAFELSIELVHALLKGSKELDIQGKVEAIADIYYKNKPGPSTEAIIKAAKKRKIPVKRIGGDSLLLLGTGSKQKMVQATISSETSFLAVEHACNKQMTKDLLRNAGLPVPEGQAVRTAEEIFAAASHIGFPLVLKPLNGRQGQGVITNIKNIDELANVVNCMDQHVKQFIVEKYYEGHDYRLLVVGGKLVAASLRLPPFVIGNGEDSIRSLIEVENKNPLRGEGHEKPMTKIPFNFTVKCFLEKFGYSLESIPDKGEIVQVVGNANLSTGGQAIDVTDEIHPSVSRAAVQAAKVIGLDIAGIDLICKDITKAFHPEDAAIIEVNAAPGIRMHHYPSKGKSRDAGLAIIDHLFKNREEAAIPIVAVTGTNGKTTTTRMVAHFLSDEKTCVGMTNTDGVFIGEETIDRGDCSGPISAFKVLSHPDVDMAVLETARGGILREGLAFQHCDVGIVTNVDDDHLGIDGIETFEQLCKLKRLIPEVVSKDGICVLNADDPNVASMAKYTTGEVVFTSLDEENAHIQESLANHRKGWFIDKAGTIIFTENGKRTRFMALQDIPVTYGGTARHNTANLLQALAAAHFLLDDLDLLKEKVLTFLPDFRFSKGRFNIIERDGRQIVIDYAHNFSGLAAVFQTVKEMKSKRVITVLSAPGDRLDKDITKLGELAASQSQVLVIKEDAELRGREPLEVPGILMKATGQFLPENQVHMVPEEAPAFIKAWELSHPGDVLLLLYEDFDQVHKFINEINKKPSIDK